MLVGDLLVDDRVERAVQKVEDKEEEERKLRLIEAAQEMDVIGMENQPVEPDMSGDEAAQGEI